MLVESGCRVRLLNFSTDAGNARLGFKIGDHIFDAHRAAARQDFSQSALNSLPGSVDDYLRAPLAQQDQLRELIAAGEESGSSSDGVYTDDEKLSTHRYFAREKCWLPAETFDHISMSQRGSTQPTPPRLLHEEGNQLHVSPRFQLDSSKSRHL